VNNVKIAHQINLRNFRTAQVTKLPRVKLQRALPELFHLGSKVWYPNSRNYWWAGPVETELHERAPPCHL